MKIIRWTTIGLLIVVIAAFAATDQVFEKKVVVKKGDGYSLGVAIQDADEEDLQKYNISGGAEIIEVMDDSEAEKIGLQDGDIITEFDGSKVKDAKQLKDLVSDISEEKTVQIKVLRDGKEKLFQAKLAPHEPKDVKVMFSGDDMNFDFDFDPEDFAYQFYTGEDHAAGKGGYLGIYTENLNDQLKQYFEVDHGALVKKVVEDSPAEKAGLKAGDVILQIEEKEIDDRADLVRTINYYDPGQKVNIRYSRKGKNNDVDVVLGEKKGFSIWMDKDGEDHHILHFNKDFGKKFQKKMEKLNEKLDDLKNINIDIELYMI
jgi:serine protease Do